MRHKLFMLVGGACILFAGVVVAGSVPGLFNYQGRLMDSAGQPVNAVGVPVDFSLWDQEVSLENVTDETVLMGGTAAVPLAHQDITTGSEVVTAVGGSPVYETPRDYVVDYASGAITRVAGGFILDGTTIEIDYEWTSYGNMLWSESQLVDITGGLYQTAVGLVNPLSPAIFSGGTVYLEVVIDGETLSPRRELTSVPYAINAESLDGLDSADFSLSGHSHDFSELSGAATDSQVANDITVYMSEDSARLGGLSPDDYVSAYGDTVKGLLEIEGDAQVDKNLYVDGDATIMGRNIGLGRAPNFGYGIRNDASTAPAYGAYLYGTSYGVMGYLASDPSDHYGALGSSNYGVYGRSGNSDETGSRYGGYFGGYSQDTAYGVYGFGYGYSVDPANGVYGFGYNGTSSGEARGVYGYAQKSTITGDAKGVEGYSYNPTSGDAYGGYFNTSALGNGTHYGVYAESDDYPVYAVYGPDPDDHYAYLSSPTYGIYTKSGNSDETGNRYGGRFNAYSQDYTYGVSASAYGYSTDRASGVYGYASNSSSGEARGLYGYAYKGSSGSGDTRGVYGYSYNSSYGDAYGGYFRSSTAGNGYHYGVYASSDDYPVYAEYGPDPDDHYAFLASSSSGLYVQSGDTNETSSRYGARMFVSSESYAYGVHSYVHGYGYGSAYVFRGNAENHSTGPAYGAAVYGYSDSGSAYGLYAGAMSTSGSAYGLYVPDGSKNWVNPDPEDPEKSIAYVTVEAGENLTYCRGTSTLVNGQAKVILPDHFRKVTSPDHPVTVQLTPRSVDTYGLALINAGNESIEVAELKGAKGNFDFDYTVQGVRLGYEDYEPIIDNVDYVPFEGNNADLDPSETTTQEWYDRKSPGMKRILKKNGTLTADGKVNERAFEARGWKVVKERAPKKEHPKPNRHNDHPASNEMGPPER